MSGDKWTTTCYRHPGRPAGIRCQRCDRVVCRQCMEPAAVGVQCPECVAEVAVRTPRAVAAPAPAAPYVTYALIGANLAFAAAGIASGEGWFEGRLGTIGVRLGLLGGGFELVQGRRSFIGVDSGEWYRVISGGFLHAGPIHLAFNMILLWQLGLMLEPVMGRPRFALLYLVSLLGGSFGALLLAPDTVTVGASGAVFGLMGALFLAERMSGVGMRQSSVGLLIVLNLGLTFALPGISVGGHVGGLVAGTATGWMFHEYARRRLSPWVPTVVAGVLGLVLFAGSIWAASTWAAPLL